MTTPNDQFQFLSDEFLDALPAFLTSKFPGLTPKECESVIKDLYRLIETTTSVTITRSRDDDRSVEKDPLAADVSVSTSLKLSSVKAMLDQQQQIIRQLQSDILALQRHNYNRTYGPASAPPPISPPGYAIPTPFAWQPPTEYIKPPYVAEKFAYPNNISQLGAYPKFLPPYPAQMEKDFEGDQVKFVCHDCWKLNRHPKPPPATFKGATGTNGEAPQPVFDTDKVSLNINAKELKKAFDVLFDLLKLDVQLK